MSRRAILTVAAASAAAAAALVGVAGGTTTAPQVRVGLVYQATSIADPYHHGVLVGLRRAVRLRGVSVRVIAVSPKQDPLQAFRYLARQRYDLVLTYGFLMTGAVDMAARQFPGRTFAIVDASVNDLKHTPKNVQGGHFRTEQGAYLAGYLSGLLERRRPGRDVVGSVGGFEIPTVDAYIAGYQAGARKADPAIHFLNSYSHDFAVTRKCKAVASKQIAAGAGVVFQVADFCGRGTLQAAKERGVWGIGVDVDQSPLGSHILTSVVKRLDIAVFDTIKAFKEGKLRPGSDAVFDLANGGVALGTFSPRVSRALIARLEPIRRQILAGKITVPVRLGPR